MTQALNQEEREEMANLAAEMELDPGARRTYATELLRLRSFVCACRRDRRRLPAKLQTLLALKCPERPTRDDWQRLADPRHAPAPAIEIEP